MPQTEQAIIAPEQVSSLRQGLDSACLELLLLKEQADSAPNASVTIETRPREAPKIILHSIYGELVDARGDVLFAAHSLEQAGDRDSAEGDDLAYIQHIPKSLKRLARKQPIAQGTARIRDFSPNLAQEHIRDFHLMLKRIQTVDGERVSNPFGQTFAREVSLGNIVLAEGQKR
ncbi:MAG: hypothetical protein AAB462_01835 [Patescibacteria group bacterium]